MENESLSYIFEYGDYGDLPTFPVDCPDGACSPESSHSLRVIPLLLYAVIVLLGVPGNAMVGWVTWKESSRRLVASWFLLVAVADLLCCLSLPFLAVPIGQGGHWPYGAVGCWLLPSFILFSMYASVLLLVGLSGDLCLLAVRPLWWASTRRTIGVKGAQVAAWLLALLLTVPSAIHRRLVQEHFPSRLLCGLDYHGSITVEATITAIRFFFGFLGPLVIVAVCHGILHCQMARKHWRLGTAVVVGFFICWAPYHILGVVLAVATPNSLLLFRALKAEPLVVGLALAHSCLNPVIFLCMGRGHLRQSLPAACLRALRESQDEESALSKIPTTSHHLVSELEV